MRLISTRTHGIIDYALGLMIIISPWTFSFSSSGAATVCALCAGSFTIALSLVTRFEGGAYKLIGLKFHLGSDALLGSLLAASPWIFKFSERVFKPHLVFGLALVFVSLLTDRILYSRLGHD
jgi:hypothetical protein